MKRLLIFVLVSANLLLADSKTSTKSKISPDLPKSTGNQLIEVIVAFKRASATNSSNGQNGQNGQNGKDDEHKQNGKEEADYDDNVKHLSQKGEVKTKLSKVNSVHMKLTLSAIQELEEDPTVAYVTPNRKTKGALDVTTQTVAANLVWQLGYSGTGVGVAVIDSGIALKPDLMGANGITSRVVYSQNFVSGQDTSDGYGHGTHVAGIIGANGHDSTGPVFARTFKGVAPNVNLISLKVLDQNGNGQEADVIAAIQTAIALKSTYNIRVINLSLGRPVFESYTLDPLCQAVEAAWNAGIVVVTAAGNSGRDNSRGTRGYGTIASPGNDPYVITVGATNSKGTPSPYDDAIASYSSKGPTAVDHIVKPDLVAPGNGVVSLLASTNCTLFTQSSRTHVGMGFETLGLVSGVSNSYLKLSGTSMATPVVAGAAALLIQQNPNLTPDQVKERLMRSAKKILPAHMFGVDGINFAQFRMVADIFTVGAGYLDINAALANTDLITVPAVSPTAIYDSVTHLVGLKANFSKLFGMDDSVVWGDSLFAGLLSTGTRAVWGADDSVVWGDSLNSAFSVVWGDTASLAFTITATSDDDNDQ